MRVPIPPPALHSNETKTGKLSSDKTGPGSRGNKPTDLKASVSVKAHKGELQTKTTGNGRVLKRELDAEAQDSNRFAKRRLNNNVPAQKPSSTIPVPQGNCQATFGGGNFSHVIHGG